MMHTIYPTNEFLKRNKMTFLNPVHFVKRILKLSYIFSLNACMCFSWLMWNIYLIC